MTCKPRCNHMHLVEFREVNIQGSRCRIVSAKEPDQSSPACGCFAARSVRLNLNLALQACAGKCQNLH